MSSSYFDNFYAEDAALWLCGLNPVEWRKTFKDFRDPNYDFFLRISEKEQELLAVSTSYFEALITTFPNTAEGQSNRINRINLIQWCEIRGIDADMFRRAMDDDKLTALDDQKAIFFRDVLNGNNPQFYRLKIAMEIAYFLFSDPPGIRRSRNKIIESFIDQTFTKYSSDVNFKKHLTYIATDNPNKK